MDEREIGNRAGNATTLTASFVMTKGRRLGQSGATGACRCQGQGGSPRHQAPTGKRRESLRGLARGLNAQDIPTSRGEGEWSAAQVARVLKRLRAWPADEWMPGAARELALVGVYPGTRLRLRDLG